MKTIKHLFFSMASILLVSCYWTETQQQPVKEEQIHVKTVTSKKESRKQTKVYYGELQFYKTTSFAAEQSGIITKLNVRPGQTVKRGEVIIIYPPINHQLQIDQARIAYKKTLRDYKRQEELLKAGAVSKVSVEAFRAQMEVEAKTLEQLQNINVIKAPFSGIITRVPTKFGEEVGVGQTLFSMAKTTSVTVNFYVTPKDISKIKIGTTAYVTLANKKVKGRISKRAIQMDPERKAFLVTALFNSPELPFVGGNAKIQLELEKALSSIWVPVESLKQSGKRSYVFVIDNGKAVEKDVRIGERDEVSVQILEGIKEGEQIITAGVEKVEHNSLVLKINK